MPTEKMPSPLQERLAPEEIASLRRRFANVDGAMPDVRADGATTLEDVAETLGVPAAEVRRQLDRIREERAVAPAVQPRKDQRGLLVFAAFLLGSAYAIHVLNPRRLSEEERMTDLEQRLADVKARNLTRPHPVHYPISSIVKTGPLPPEGFSVEFRGALTTTDMGTGPRGPMPRATAQPALEEALYNGIQTAREAESRAPVPSKPLPTKPFGGWEPKPGSLAYSIGGSGFGETGPIDLGPRGNGSTEADDRFFARQTAASAVENTVKQQEASLKLDPPRNGVTVLPPAGYTVEFDGWQKLGAAGTPLRLLPLDPARVRRKLEWTVRNMIWKDAEPPELTTSAMRAELAKRAIPTFANVTITGPLGPVSLRLPMTASPDYPTAADAARASDRILSEGVRKAAAQIGDLNRGVRRK